MGIYFLRIFRMEQEMLKRYAHPYLVAIKTTFQFRPATVYVYVYNIEKCTGNPDYTLNSILIPHCSSQPGEPFGSRRRKRLIIARIQKLFTPSCETLDAK